jgi:hypothetical protein
VNIVEDFIIDKLTFAKFTNQAGKEKLNKNQLFEKMVDTYLHYQYLKRKGVIKNDTETIL